MLQSCSFIFLVTTWSMMTSANTSSDLMTMPSVNIQRKILSKINTGMENITETGVLSVLRSVCPSNPVCHTDEPKVTMETELVNVEGCCISCSCDIDCFVTGTCCSGFKITEVNNTETSTSNVQKTCTEPFLLNSESEGQRTASRETPFPAVAMVTSCPKKNTSPYYVRNCLSPLSHTHPLSTNVLPTTSLTTGITYSNSFCALCNGEPTTQPWLVVFSIARNTSAERYRGLPLSVILSQTVEDILSEGLSSSIISYHPQPGTVSDVVMKDICELTATESSAMIAECNITGLWEEYNKIINQSCVTYEQPFKMNRSLYKNAFCMLCNVDSVKRRDSPTSGLLCKMASLNNVSGPSGEVNLEIFEPVNTRSIEEPSCRCVINSLTGECRKTFCPPGFMLRSCVCVQAITRVSGIPVSMLVKVSRQNGQLLSSDLTLEEFGEKICTRLAKQTVSPDDITLLDSVAFVKERTTTPTTFICALVVMATPQRNTVGAMDQYLKTLQNSAYLDAGSDNDNAWTVESDPAFRIMLNIEPGGTQVIDTTDGRAMISLGPIDENNNGIALTEQFSKLFTCEQVELSKEEYFFINKALVYSTTTDMVIRDFLTFGDRVRVCAADYTGLFATQRTNVRPATRLSPTDEDGFSVAGTLSFACMVISLVFGLYTVITYLMFKSLRNTPGMCNMFLSIHIFCAQLVFIFGLDQTEDHNVCVALGVLIHFLWLSSVLWMQACCFHMYRSFVGDLRDRMVEYNANCGIILRYVCYSWGMATLLVVATLVTSHLMFNEIGYGQLFCYISRPLLVGWFFVLPTGVVLVLNAAMFITVVVAIHRQSSFTPAMVTKKNSILVYVKLSTITGISWAFGYMYIWTEIALFEHLFIILNGGQGLFIAMSFVMSSNVRNLWRSCLGCPKKMNHSSMSNSNQNNVFSVTSSL